MGKGPKTPGPTAEEIELARISREQLQRYKEVFAPLEDKWLQDSRVSAGEKALLGGQIGGEVEQQFAPQSARLGGMNPAGGGFTAGARDLAVAKAKAGGRAQAGGVVQAENADVSAVMSGVRMGRGQAVEAQQGMEQMASLATSEAMSKALLKQASRDATADMVGSGLGVVAYGAGKMGTPNVSDTELVANGGSVGARNAQRQQIGRASWRETV